MLTAIVEALRCGKAGCSCNRSFGNNLVGHCPCHQDAKPSLSIKEEGGKILLHCHGGCAQADVIAALQARNLWTPPKSSISSASPQRAITPSRTKSRPRRREIAAVYDYSDEAGTLLFQAVRYEPKGFTQRRPATGDTWIYSLEGVRRVLYRLPALIAAIAAGKTVWITEGEKDADALIAHGLVATCNPMGAGKWQPEYSEALTGANIVLLPDNDKAGRDHVQQIAESVHSVAGRVRIVILPGLPEKGDVSHWLTTGGTIPDLVQLAKAATDWTPDALPAIETNESAPTR